MGMGEDVKDVQRLETFGIGTNETSGTAGHGRGTWQRKHQSNRGSPAVRSNNGACDCLANIISFP